MLSLNALFKKTKKQTYYWKILKFESSFGFTRSELLVAIVTTLCKRELYIITIIPKYWIAAQSFASWHTANLKVHNSIVARQPKWLFFFFLYQLALRYNSLAAFPNITARITNYSPVKGILEFRNSKESLPFVHAFCSFLIKPNSCK